MLTRLARITGRPSVPLVGVFHLARNGAQVSGPTPFFEPCALEWRWESARQHWRQYPIRRTDISPDGTDAPICQDSRSRSQVCGLARSVVCHHALKDLAGEKAFETADDLPFGPPFSGASFDVVEGW